MKISTFIIGILGWCLGWFVVAPLLKSYANENKQPEQPTTRPEPSIKVHSYLVKFTGDNFHAGKVNADVELHGGKPSFNKGFKISVPSEYHFEGTELKFDLREDPGEGRHYVLAQLYKDGDLIYEQDNETLYRKIQLMDLNIGRTND